MYALALCSESSMFVTKDRFILKTCGTTTLLHCVGGLLKLVKDKVGYDKIGVSEGFISVKYIIMYFVNN